MTSAPAINFHSIVNDSTINSKSTLANVSVNTDKTKLRVGLCQLLIGSSKSENLKRAERSIAAAVGQGAQLVILPEMFNCPYSNDSFPTYAEILPQIQLNQISTIEESKLTEDNSPTSIFVAELAKKHNIYLVAGSIPESHDNKLYNTSLVINPKGQFIAKHRKVHLFDINVPGKMVFKESETLSPGNCITTFSTEYGKFGLAICYDMRFPELAQAMAKQGCNMLIYPGAFNTTTGPLHWELLQRARAVDNELYVITCSPARNPESKYQAWGHSSVISPWGTIEATTEHDEAVIVADIDFEQVREMRRNIPTLTQKRHDLYELVNKTLAK
jgi:omega-amidase